MPLDTRIALGGQPSQIQFRDPIATYNQLAQLTSADTQNRLAQMQMQEHEQMAPYRTQEAQSKAAMSKLTLDQAVEARDFLTKTMKAAEENSNGTAPKDLLAVIKAFLGHPNKQVQDVGTHMANAYQLIQDFEADQRYATAKGGLAGAPAGVAAVTPAAAAPPMAAAAPAAPQEMFVTKDSSGRPRYVVNGTEVSPQDYQSAQSGVVVSATPAAKLIGYNLPVVEPTNALAPTAAAPAANVNAMVAPVAKTAADIKAEIDNGELQYGRSKRWAKERELLLDQYKEAIKTPVYHNVPGVGLVNPATRQTLVPSVEPTQAEIKQYEYAKAQGFTGDIFEYERRLKEAGRPPPTPATPSAPVAVVGADGKIKYVSREEAIAKGMTPASAMEGLAPKEIQSREAKYPVAKRATTTVSATMTEIENTIDRLLANEKGLSGITGFVGGRTYAVTDEARKAEADLKQLKNLAFVQGLTELRNASSTGAGVGNVSNKEGDRFENLKASLEQTQSTDDLIASLKRLKSQSTATRDTVNQAFEDTYAYRTNTAAPQGTGGFKYLGKE